MKRKLDMLQLLMFRENVQRSVPSEFERLHFGKKNFFTSNNFARDLRKETYLSAALVCCFPTLLLEIAYCIH